MDIFILLLKYRILLSIGNPAEDNPLFSPPRKKLKQGMFLSPVVRNYQVFLLFHFSFVPWDLLNRSMVITLLGSSVRLSVLP